MKLFSITGLLLFLTLLLPASLKAQTVSQPDSILNLMTGEWLLEGTIDGQKTTHDVEVQRVLNGQYIQIKEVSREKDETGNPQYQALVYLCWEKPKQQYSCLWLDNTSNAGLSNGITGIAKLDGNRIGLVFKFSESVKFHTTFLFEPATGTWQWQMDSEEKGEFQPFARLVMRRAQN